MSFKVRSPAKVKCDAHVLKHSNIRHSYSIWGIDAKLSVIDKGGDSYKMFISWLILPVLMT